MCLILCKTKDKIVLMLKNQSDKSKSMTIQSIECISQKEMDSEKNNSSPQQLSQNKNGHISFSVASLLADTRPSKSVSPQQISSPTVPSHSSDDEYDSNQEDSIVDVEDINAEKSPSPSPSKEQQELYLSQNRERDFQQIQGPIRPTPFSALAAAVYQAAHPNWAAQGLVGHFPGPAPMFQGPASFGVPSLNPGKSQNYTYFYQINTLYFHLTPYIGHRGVVVQSPHTFLLSFK